MAQNHPLNPVDPEKQTTECKNFEAPDSNGSVQNPKGYLGFQPMTEEVDFEKPKKKRHTWKLIVLCLVLCALFIGGMLVGYYIRHTDEDQRVTPTQQPCTLPVQQQQRGSDPRHLELIHENLMYSMNGDRIATQLGNFTLLETYSGSLSDSLLVEIIKSAFSRAGLEDHSAQKYNAEYEVLVSFPNPQKPNMIQIIQNYGLLHMEPDLQELCRLAREMNMSNSNCELPEIQEQAPPTTTTTTPAPPPPGDVVPPDDQMSVGGSDRRRPKPMTDMQRKMMEAVAAETGNPPEIKADPRELMREQQLPFVAYTPSGVAHGEIMYLNYGTHEDFNTAVSLGGSVSGKIGFMRLGKTSIREKIREAEARGVIGLVLYRDPADIPYKENCTSDAPFLNANDEDMGDPLTPGYPSTRGMLRGTMEEAKLPRIPVQGASCKMALYLHSNLTTTQAPPSWQGGFNLTYSLSRRSSSAFVRWTVGWLGPPWTVRLEIENSLRPGPVYNVIGRLTGQVDPDHYVIIGANRNSYTRGQHGAVIGTSMLLEFTRNLAYLIYREKWRPKRTLMLCSWGGGDYGNIGMVEFLQEYKETLSGRVVTYINLDDPVLGDWVLGATTSTVLEDILYNVAQRVPSPDDRQFMLYHTWMERNNARKTNTATTASSTTTPTTTTTAPPSPADASTTLATPVEMEINLADSLEVETLSPQSDEVTYDMDADSPSSSPSLESHPEPVDSEPVEADGPTTVLEEDAELPLTTAIPEALEDAELPLTTATPEGLRRRRSVLVEDYGYEWETTRPYQALQEGRSDPFFTILGTPTIHLQYRGPSGKTPVKNITEPEKPESMTEAEHHYRHHMTVGRVAGLLALSIADSTVLQLDIVAAAKRLQGDVLKVNQDIAGFSEVTAASISNASHQLVLAAQSLHHYIFTTADFSVEAQRRMINERLVHCQKHMSKVSSELIRIEMYFSGASISLWDSSHMRAVNRTLQSPAIPLSYANRELSKLLHYLQMAVQTLKIEMW